MRARPGPALTLIVFAACALPMAARADEPWTGTWSTTFGDLVLEQDGRKVEGRYETPPGSTMSGEVEGRVLAGTWRQSDGSGTFTFELAEDGRSFAGSYAYRTQSGEWNGSLESRPTPSEEPPEVPSSDEPGGTLMDVPLTDSQAAVAKELGDAYGIAGPNPTARDVARIRAAFDAAVAAGIPDDAIVDGQYLAMSCVRFRLPILEGTITEEDARRAHADAFLELRGAEFQGTLVFERLKSEDFLPKTAKATVRFFARPDAAYLSIEHDFDPRGRGMGSEVARNTVALRNENGSITLVDLQVPPPFHGVVRGRRLECVFRTYNEFARFSGTIEEPSEPTSEPADPPAQPDPPAGTGSSEPPFLTPEQEAAAREYQADFARVVGYVQSIDFLRKQVYGGDEAKVLSYQNGNEAGQPDLNDANAAVPRARKILAAVDGGLAYLRHEKLSGEVTTFDAAGIRAACEAAIRYGSLAIHATDLASKAYSASNWKDRLAAGGDQAQAMAMVANEMAKECLASLEEAEKSPIASLIQVKVGDRPMTFGEIRSLAVSLARSAQAKLAEIDAAYQAQRAPYLAALSGDRRRVFEEVFGLELKCYGLDGKVLSTPEEYASSPIWASVGYPPGPLPRWEIDVYRWDGMTLQKLEKKTGPGPYPPSAEFR